MKKTFLFLLLMTMFTSNVNAEACDSADIKRLKEIAEGVEITYELQEPFEQEHGIIKDVYKINIIGLTDEILILNESDNESYDINTNFNDFIFYGGKKRFEIYSEGCSRNLKNIDVKLPVYNTYSDGNFCKQDNNRKLSVCQTWVDEKITEKEYFDEIHNNKEEKKENFIYKNLNIIIIVFVLIFISIIIFKILKKKKEVLV